MSSGARRRRRAAQNGVEAVFTPGTNWKGRAQLMLGLVAVGVGAASWTYTTRAFGGSGLGGLVPWNPSVSAILLSISIPLLIAGVGLCTYYFAVRRTWRASSHIESALLELESFVGQKNINSEFWLDHKTVPYVKRTRKLRFDFLPKTLAVALVEAVILVIIYSGLVQEYVSNAYMRNWVQTNFALGSYLLNYYIILVLAGLLGVLIFGLLPRKLQPRGPKGLSPASRTSGREEIDP